MTIAHCGSCQAENSLPAGWGVSPLGAIAEINPGRLRTTTLHDNTVPTTFVPMAAVDERTGTIRATMMRPFGEVKKGYVPFKSGDVLFAKITPCMQNGKHAVVGELSGDVGFASTEFHVLRAGPNVVAEWIHLYLRQPAILALAERSFTGSAGQQRVPASFLSGLPIPLPPLERQRELVSLIAEHLAVIERARAAAETQAEAISLLRTAILHSVISDGSQNGWEVVPLGSLGEIVSGVTLGRRPPAGAMRTVPYLTVANVKDGYLRLDDVRFIEVTDSELEKWALTPGDLLLTEGGDPDKLGRGTIWRGELANCIHQNHIFRVRFRSNAVLPEFAAAQVSSPYGKAYFLAHAKQTTGIATINQRVLRAFPFKRPPMHEQRRIVAALRGDFEEIERLRQRQDAQLQAVKALPAALLRHAFSAAL